MSKLSTILTTLLLTLLSFTAWATELTPLEVRLVTAVNKYRATYKLAPLTVDPVLQRVARLRVGVFNHNHPRFGWVREHAHRAGFAGFATDNLAQGYETPESAVGNRVSGWGDERKGHTVGHNLQLRGFAKVNGRWVNYQFNRIGVAIRGRTYIAVFGRDTRDSSDRVEAVKKQSKPSKPGVSGVMELVPELRQRNRLGSCVHASTVNLMRWARLYGPADIYWRRYRGGESPGPHSRKLTSCGIRYAMTTNGDERLLEWAITNRRGAGIGWGTDHYINFVGRFDNRALLLDNNGSLRVFSMPWEQFVKKWRRSGGWATVILSGKVPPPAPRSV